MLHFTIFTTVLRFTIHTYIHSSVKLDRGNHVLQLFKELFQSQLKHQSFHILHIFSSILS